VAQRDAKGDALQRVVADAERGMHEV